MTQILGFNTLRQRGFTLLELMLVLGILGMTVLLVTPRLGSLDGPGFNAQVREANNLLNYARRSAVVQGQTTRITFHPNAPDADTPDPAPSAGQWIARDISLVYRDSTGRTQALGERLDVEFYPEGGSSGGALRFSQGSRQVTIHVDPFSGRVQVRHEE